MPTAFLIRCNFAREFIKAHSVTQLLCSGMNDIKTLQSFASTHCWMFPRLFVLPFVKRYAGYDKSCEGGLPMIIVTLDYDLPCFCFIWKFNEFQLSKQNRTKVIVKKQGHLMLGKNDKKNTHNIIIRLSLLCFIPNCYFIRHLLHTCTAFYHK